MASERTLKDVSNEEAIRQLVGSARVVVPLKECCRLIKLMQEIGWKCVSIYREGRTQEVAKLNYCPECGRKL